MRAIINGKRYDTSKAEFLGQGYSKANRGDFSFWKAGLYRTPRSRAFFLAGLGGPMTRFAEPVGQNGMQGGSKVIPLTAGEALEWAEQHLNPDEVEAAFGSVIEDA